MGLIIDTCIFIKVEREKSLIDFNRWSANGIAYLSTISISELLLGVHRADTEARKLKRSAFVESIIAAFPILDYNREVARIHAEISHYLLENKQIIGAHDLLIAATALRNGCAVLTTNAQKFNRVPGLQVLAP